MWQIYFLKSVAKRWYYVGSTNDIERRLKEHNSGKVSATKAYVPLLLVYSEQFENEKDARTREQKIKKQRLLKEQIIRTIE
ncbi:MAG: GIY-YIG nuclease family protein [Minisyncoccia bacterium]